ncbi:hypothetical protein OsI_30429 [Oryza sativa Indica Group]|uniref:Uncharacterized protein n=1 Tax=Oryza sativa subsp. indica TaxID=39946 RepID=B8BD01_ORYSI|nr:hypothetical protein OsI_30429 [Oryza sativa Indica Group]
MARGLDTGQGEAAVVAAVEGSGFGHRALHMAASGGSVDVLRYLVEDLRLGVNQFNGKGQTPLFLSSIHGRAAATRYLLNHGSNPAIDKTVLPLHGAAVKGHCEIVELFLSKGVDVDLYSIAGTPLLAAAISGQHSTMKILLEHHADVGADMNFRDSNGVTCVMVAANHGSSVIMKCLLDAGANPNIPDEDNDLSKRKSAELKLQAREAFERNDYALAVQHYTNNVAAQLAQSMLSTGAAFMFIKDYGKACEAFADGLKLDPANEDIKKALRDAEEAMKKDKMERRG